MSPPPQNQNKNQSPYRINVSGIEIAWDVLQGTCRFESLPVAMMWIDTTLAGLLSGVQAMVGTERFRLALQSEGRKSVDADWQVISRFEDFADGFKAIANIAAVAGWGDWRLLSIDSEKKQCLFRVLDSWEGRYQKALGVCWGSSMVAGKLAGYCSKLFNCNCWAEQTSFIAQGGFCDEFLVQPSARVIEEEIDKLLASDQATRADMAAALQRLQREIADRKQAQEALAESEERFRLFMRHFPGLAYIKDASSRVLFVNEGFQKYLGLNPTDAIGKANQDLFPPEFAEKITIDDQRIIEAGECDNIEEEFAGRYWSTFKFPLPQPGKPPILGGFTLDVTERKKAEADRLNLERQLQQTQKLESLGVLAGGIAHDFNNLLTVILGNADMALSDLPVMSPVHNAIAEIEKAARRAADLCHQMLAYSGRGRFVIETLSLGNVVKEMVHLLQTSISKKALLQLNLAGDLPPMRGDATQIRQIIMNLVINASEAIGNTDGIITLTTGVTHCSREYLQDAYSAEELPEGLYVWLEVSDNGCGMDADTRSRIFEPFYTTKFAGRGLGLSAVLGIMCGHKGTLKVQSEVDKGTTFRVLFPVEKHDELPAFKPIQMDDDWKGHGIILLVDDDDSVRTLGKRMLERLGFQVLTAKDGKEALQTYREQAKSIKLVLLDLTMPHMDGEETFQELQRIDPAVRVVMASGYAESEVSKRFAGKGLAGFVQKPYVLAGLKQRLRSACD